MTKKFIQTNKSMNGPGVKKEFLIPDIYGDSKCFIGIDTNNRYEFGLIVYTGAELDEEIVLARAIEKKSIGFFQRKNAKKRLKIYLAEIKSLKIDDTVRLSESIGLEKVKK